MKTLPRVFRLALVAMVVIGVAMSIPERSLASDPVPSGERITGQSIMEPVYNDLDGSVSYILTPIHTPLIDPTNNHAVAPLYVIVYPSSAAGVIGTVNCQHQPMDNCPDHGPELAGLAKSVFPAVYGGGVWGHDHILSAHPNASPASADFNVAWLPVAVLFTSSSAANNHITTLSQLNAALAAGQVMEIPLVGATFQCSPVPATVYNLGTPVTPAPPVP